jgi:hypothetical protein
VVPGWLVYSALTRRTGFSLRHVTVGWALGYAVELAAFMSTAALGIRHAYDFYPLAVAAATIPFLVSPLRARIDHARKRGHAPRYAPGWAWALAGLLAYAFVDMAVEQFPVLRLPWNLSDRLFFYAHDQLLALNVSAEAAQHWPITAPNVVGEHVHYHYFAFLHMSAIRQVTHLDLVLIDFRLVTIPLLVLATLLAFVLGRKLAGGSPWVGFGAALLALFVGHPSVISVLVATIALGLVLVARRTDPRIAIAGGAAVLVAGALTFDTWKPALIHPAIAMNAMWQSTFDTPTFALGEVLFLAIAIELSDRLANPDRIRDRWGSWVVIAALMAAAAGAKAAVPVVLVGGLVLALVYCLRFERRAVRTLATALGASVVTLGAAWALLFSGGNEGDLALKPGATGRALLPNFSHTLDPHSGPMTPKKLVLFGIVSLIALAWFLAPLAPGLWVELRQRRWRPPAVQVWLLAMLVTGTGLALCFEAGGNAQSWFAYYGYIAGAFVAVLGFAALWRSSVAVRRSAAVTGLAVASVVAFLAITTAAPSHFVRAAVSGPDYRTPSPPSYGVNRDLFTGLRWVRDHTGSSNVLAVNTVFNSRACYYTAFTERRFLMECSFPETVRNDYLNWPRVYPDRFALNEAIFRRGEAAAVRSAQRRFGVSYLLVDLVPGHGGSPAMASRVGRVARPVYRNAALAVFRVP